MADKYMIGLSGGINSMAVLCWLAEQPNKPDEIHLYYAHFKEHSPDTFQFVADGIRFARRHFKTVHVKITRNSIMDYFEKCLMIPHPALSNCTRELKIEPMESYAFDKGITIDLIGYVKHELKRRAGNQQQSVEQGSLFPLSKIYPIGEFTDEWCFEIVDRLIGWHPALYDILFTQEDCEQGLCNKKEIGTRVFKHNNCLPCKNMYPHQIAAVKKYYFAYYMEAIKLSAKLGKFWGRNADEFYTTFGRDLGQEITCKGCKF